MRVGIVGTGVAGLVCAAALSDHHDVVVWEAGDHVGGHAHTVDVEVGGRRVPIDVAFMVFNEITYPNLCNLFARLGIETTPTDMSFSVSDPVRGIEWRSTNANTVFAQRRNLLDAGFLRFLAGVVRLNRRLRGVAENGGPVDYTLADLAADTGVPQRVVDDYLVPLGAAIWSADPRTFTAMPAITFARFFDNHGLLRFGRRLQWRAIPGGSRTYVDVLTRPIAGRIRTRCPVRRIDRVAGGVEVTDATGTTTVDEVVLATHSDQALALLGSPTPLERAVLGAIGYQSSSAVLHTDTRMLPSEERARASWNYHISQGDIAAPAVTYYLNRLQPIDTDIPVCLTLNRDDDVAEDQVLGRYDFRHPVLDAAAVRAQARHAEVSGRDRVHFCGAYWGYGFHEDGVRSALTVCDAFGGRR